MNDKQYNPEVSVIIPVYCVEKYIEKCARSLFVQTLQGLEFIFINDCTPDNSVPILKNVIAEYPGINVQIINLSQNMGQAEAFRTGLEAATGEYVIKCDSDDTVEATMYEDMYVKAKANNLDMVVCNIDLVYPDGTRNRFFGRRLEFDGITALLRNKVPTSLCNKLVRRELYKKKSFIHPTEPMCEDLVYSIQLEHYCRGIGFIDKSYYNYNRYPESFTWNQELSAMVAKHHQVCRNVRLVIDFLRNKGLEKKYKEDIIHQCLFVKTGLRHIIYKEGIYDLWKNTFREINHKVVFCRSIPLKERGLFILVYFNMYGLYRKCKRLLQ